MRIAPVYLLAILVASSSPSLCAAQSPGNSKAIEQELQALVKSSAADEEINRYLASQHTSAESFCATIPEHRDCLQKPTYSFQNEETSALRLLAYSMRVRPSAVMFHIAVVCLQKGRETVRVQPVRAGAALAAQLTEIVCPAAEDTVHLDLELQGVYGYGRHDAGTADSFVFNFPTP